MDQVEAVPRRRHVTPSSRNAGSAPRPVATHCAEGCGKGAARALKKREWQLAWLRYRRACRQPPQGGWIHGKQLRAVDDGAAQGRGASLEVDRTKSLLVLGYG